MELLIYSEINVPRLRYVAGLLLPSAISWKISSSLTELEQYAGPSIQYGLAPKIVPQSLHIPDSGFLHHRDFRAIDPECSWEDGLPLLFPARGFDIGGDVLASIFFWLSRYEEYDPTRTRDQHGRFEAASAHATRFGYLDLPVVDAWRRRLLNILFPNLPEPSSVGFQLNWTFDIDQSSAFLGRSFLRQMGGWCRDLVQGRWRAVIDRPLVMLGLRMDPFDCFQALKGLAQKSGTSPQFFWHVGDPGPFDRVVSWKTHSLYQAIAKVLPAPIGLHPSYRSADQPELLEEEKKRLESLGAHPVTQSRQHYLRLEFPMSYRNLLQNGMHGDWSMGYQDRSGFRAGTGLAFPWFDLLEDRQTELWVHPFVVMDVTLRDYLGLDAPAARQELDRLAGICQHWEIPMTLIWHNSSFYSAYGWSGWEDVPGHFADSLPGGG